MTAEDWIAFSQLINSNTFTQYKGKTLDDFGETINGITTYYLLNDIDFKDVDCTELKQIGYAQTNYYFSQTFDGQKSHPLQYTYQFQQWHHRCIRSRQYHRHS